ncbi:MAG: hypothetical protein A2V77_09540 [Anaeromyxobacter sp. RBG_16_69_14]|nr:MAG: hypothetical protein A2V77_09540 [Anaeromyxobacter sp. RBG_16_69_14]
MRTVLSASLAFAAALTGCVGPEAQLPTVTYQGAALAQAPSQEMMAAYYCPRVVSYPLSILACPPFGDVPPASDMVVAFNLQFNVHNPNHFPIPVAEMLAAVTLFPGQSSQPLGTSCVVFCSPDEPTCTGQPGPDSCIAKAGDIRSIEDFSNATADLLVASGVSLLQGQAPSFKMPEVVQDGEAAIEARFAFGADPMLQALEQLASQSVNQLAVGELPTFTIPYRIEGTLWLDVGSLGRVAVGFGPVDGTWTIPTSELVPSL